MSRRMGLIGLVVMVLILFLVVLVLMGWSTEEGVPTLEPTQELVIELTVITLTPAPTPSIVERIEALDADSLLMQKILRMERMLEALLHQGCHGEDLGAELPEGRTPSGIQIKMMED